MVRVIVGASPIAGHFAPMRAIAENLVQRGYPVTVLTGSQFRDPVERTGARFVALPGLADYDLSRFAEMYVEAGAPSGPDEPNFAFRRLFLDPSADQHRAVQELLAEAGDEPVVVIAETGFGGPRMTRLGVPGREPAGLIGIGVTPLTLTSVDTAPYGTGLPPDSSPEGRERNRVANRRRQETYYGNIQRYVERMWRALGAEGDLPFVMDSAVLQSDYFLQLSIASVEYPRSDAPKSLRYIGTLPTHAGSTVPLPPWWGEVAAARRVIAVTQGTAANRDFSELIEPTLRALAGVDALVVATLGRPARLTGMPANARLAEFIPFDELLRHTDLLVTNGGYGGMQQALSHGVPMVLAGQSEDKREGTARVAWSGAAINLATQRPTEADIRAAVDAVLTEPRYRDRARELQAEYARHDAFQEIADTVDELAARSR
ncbi:UDP:flavonoid glycosyltransferase YjiC (YdhE family) [Micromonospora pisi]|uniref:UDP:flavonoid glycosyltransferase YjiC (YdhE family) n=1 Tax=Micromonospora pisi TaxID=589240 RepID=A0A495JI23_9ACTN|nr:nucleotide disphospho-sugar-binding domain-containing protein [Micromonospora pisi]RKR87699.1 UDP:flavonoid glycosyltransferase YjiC (YdhE family) [Micromonospora pisi]